MQQVGGYLKVKGLTFKKHFEVVILRKSYIMDPCSILSSMLFTKEKKDKLKTTEKYSNNFQSNLAGISII